MIPIEYKNLFNDKINDLDNIQPFTEAQEARLRE